MHDLYIVDFEMLFFLKKIGIILATIKKLTNFAFR